MKEKKPERRENITWLGKCVGSRDRWWGERRVTTAISGPGESGLKTTKGGL